MAISNIIKETPALRISFFWVYVALPLGALMMIIQIVLSYIFKENT